MSLGDEIASQAATPRKGPSCTVAVILADLDPTDADDLRDALAKPYHVVPNGAIVRALKARGLSIGEYTIARHRRGDCRCSATR